MAGSVSHGLALLADTAIGSGPARSVGSLDGRVCYARRPRHFGLGRRAIMWYLIEDFFEQGLIAKLFIGVGWLAVLIMVASLVDSLLP